MTKPVKSGKNQNKDTKFQKGQSGNPKGKPKGTRAFITLWRDAIKKIAKEKNIKELEAEVALVMKAYKEAEKGNYSYHKDIFDRLCGKPIQPISGEMDNTLDVTIRTYANRMDTDPQTGDSVEDTDGQDNN